MMAALFDRLKTASLYKKLVLSFTLASLVTTSISSMLLTVLDTQRMSTEMRTRTIHYAHLLQKQMEPVVAFDDRQTASEILDSFADDDEIAGLGVYNSAGELVKSRGDVPSRLDERNPPKAKGCVVAIARVHARDGSKGHVYVALELTTIHQERVRAMWRAVGIILASVALALILVGMVTRRVTSRITRIVAVAKRLASGNFEQPLIEVGSKDEVGSLAQAFNVMVAELRGLFEERTRLAATEQQRLEALVNERTTELAASREEFRIIAEETQAIPFTLDLSRECFPYVGPKAIARLGIGEERWHAPGFLNELLPRARYSRLRATLDACASGSFEVECTLAAHDKQQRTFRWLVTCKVENDTKHVRGLMLDVTEQRRLEAELTQAQKLESVGRLASGVAHEINTPVQFVTDSVVFVRDAMADITRTMQAYRELRDHARAGGDLKQALDRTERTENETDVDYVLEHSPRALERAVEGLKRVAIIVRSMKNFARADDTSKIAVDLNQGISSTLIIARNEYKLVADLETDLAELPPVTCHAGEINQVVLNLVVNAAHAVRDVVKGTDRRGTIRVATRLVGDEVEISVKDTGTGIPEEIRQKIFDPFFTTKDVGVGTGQGLAIARSIIVDKHGGSLRLETEVGKGTTFFIRLPVDERTGSGVRSAA